VSEDARVERKNGGKVHINEQRKTMSETGANYYISKYSKYMYINIYTRACARVRGHVRYACTCILDTCVHTCVQTIDEHSTRGLQRTTVEKRKGDNATQDAHDENSSGFMVAAFSIRIYLDYGQERVSFHFVGLFYNFSRRDFCMIRRYRNRYRNRRHSSQGVCLCTHVRACAHGSIGSILSSYYIVANVYVEKLPGRIMIIDRT